VQADDALRDEIRAGEHTIDTRELRSWSQPLTRTPGTRKISRPQANLSARLRPF
jgi:hypothetical protein